MLAGSTTYTRAPGETTEWEDLQRKFGNLPPLEVRDPDPPAGQGITTHHDKMLSQDKTKAEADDRPPTPPDDGVHGRTLEELEEAQDDDSFADDRHLETLRRKRMAELRAAASANKFGTLETITRADYVHQVTEASKVDGGIWVVLHLYSPRVRRCQDLDAVLAILASRNRAVKFLRAEGSECIPGYPDKNCPSLLLYRDGECRKKLVGAAETGIDIATVAAQLLIHGVITEDHTMEAPAFSDSSLEAAAAEMLEELEAELDD
jgi:hypothetical protein